jgi:D-amino-acid dehydrogenase
MPWKLLRQLFARDATLRVAPSSALAEVPWILRWWLAGRPQRHAANRSAMLRLAQFSRERLLELAHTLSLDYEQATGMLVLLRSAPELQRAQGGLRLLQELGVAHAVVDADRCRHIEPALDPRAPLHAAIHLPKDGVGNCRQFAHLMRAEALQRGARFRFDLNVRRIEAGSKPSVVTTGGERIECDAVVVCAGAESAALLRTIGLRLPLAAVHGYSITAPLRHDDALRPTAPIAGLLDDRYGVAITRLGQRVRVAGSAELGGRPDDMRAAPLALLYRVLDEWFPAAAATRAAQHWKGARPMLPDGPPVLGESGRPGVWLNLGHGSSGWALACGSARILAELISGRTSPIDMRALGVSRLR